MRGKMRSCIGTVCTPSSTPRQLNEQLQARSPPWQGTSAAGGRRLQLIPSYLNTRALPSSWNLCAGDCGRRYVLYIPDT